MESVAIIGLGYVGLPLALAFFQKGFHVVGIDSDRRKIHSIRAGESYLPDVSNDILKSVVDSGDFAVTNDFNWISEVEAIVICVPTPLDEQNNPDLSYLTNAGSSIQKHMKRGQFIVLESSTYPGTTTEILRPLLEREGWAAGTDFYLGYSPERIDPGNIRHPLATVPKIISGVTEQCARKAFELYNAVFDQVVLASSTEVAEMAKILENSYRLVNISFINEFATLCDRMNIDVWEVIEAAGTKPYGFSKFFPGPGVGGHCIPVDPMYLQWKSKKSGLSSEFIELSAVMNHRMPSYIVNRVKACLPFSHLKGARILIVGLAYKKDINDIRESAAVELMRLFHQEGCRLEYHDPYVPTFEWNGAIYRSIDLSESNLINTDCVIIATGHSHLPIQKLLDYAPLIYDTRNVTKGLSGKARVIRLGGGANVQR